MWTDEEKQKLRELWDLGYTTIEIGKFLGKTKNAVCGKARRMNLPMRQEGTPRKNAVRPPKLIVQRDELKKRSEVAEKDLGACTGYFKQKRCKWPLGDPRKPGFSFCTAERGKGSYCPGHAEIAYTGK